jgi:hypothetical protein
MLRSELAEAAVSRVAPSTGERRRLGKWLREQAADLGSIRSDYPPVAARLLDDLVTKGLSVAQPRCVDCDRHRALPMAVDGGRVCSQCYMLRRTEPCARCGRTKLVSTRQPNGLAVCQRCRTSDPSTWRPCGRCGRRAQVVTMEGGLTIGRCCYVPPLLRCTVCGVNKARRPYKTRRPVCTECADRPKATCSACGLDAPLPIGQDESPLCSRCCSVKPAPCWSCSALTVGRDRNGNLGAQPAISGQLEHVVDVAGCARSCGSLAMEIRICAASAGRVQS